MKKIIILAIFAITIFVFASCKNPSDIVGATNSSDNISTSEPTDSIVEQPSQESQTEATTSEPSPTFTLTTYSNTDEYGKAGTYTIHQNMSVSVGEQVLLTATVNDGYNFVGWFIDNICVSEDLIYNYCAVAKNVRIEARYNYFTVSTGSNTNDRGNAGTFTEMNQVKVSVGTSVTVSAQTNAGYNFVGWYIGNICVSEDPTYSFIMKAERLYLEAKYNSYTVSTGTFAESAAGSFTQINAQKISIGEQVTLSAVANDGYNFEGWYYWWSDTCVSKDSTYTFTMKAENVDLEARFSSYTVSTGTYAESAAGTFTQLNEKKISVGEQVTLSAVANEGYNFEGWYYWWSDTCVSKDSTYTFTMKAENVDLEARFSCYVLNVYGYTYEGMAGSITEYNDQKISVGTQITLTATAQNGYNFEGWYEWDTCISKDLTYTFIMPANDVGIEAKYSCYKLSVYGNTFEGTAGDITEYSEEIIAYNEQIPLTVTVNDGFNFEGWYINGICVSTDLTYMYTMSDHDEYIEAVFNYYTVSTSGYTYESMAGDFTHYDEKKFSIGQEVTVTATVRKGYRFDGWYVNGICVSENPTYSFIMKNQSIWLEAVYEES